MKIDIRYTLVGSYFLGIVVIFCKCVSVCIY